MLSSKGGPVIHSTHGCRLSFLFLLLSLPSLMPQNYSRDTLRQGEDFASVLKDTLCKYVKGHLKTIRTLPPHVSERLRGIGQH